MARRSQGQGRLSNRQKTWIWIIITTAIIVSLLYWEQIALLYVLVTISMTFLLLVVAISDLSSSKAVPAAATTGEKPLAKDAAAIEAKPAVQSTFASRPRKRRR